MPRDGAAGGWEGPDGYRVVTDAWRAAWTPRARLSTSRWADDFRFLSDKSSREHGKWKTSRVPYLREIMDALDDDHPAEIVVFIKSAQVGGSEVGINWLGKTIHYDPCPFAALFPTDKLATRWVRGRLEASISVTPALSAVIPLGRKSDRGQTMQEKHFPGGVFYAWSANIPSDMSSTPIARLLCDEVDRFPRELDNEGAPVELALRRQATYEGRRKAFLNSTPTVESLSTINEYWKTSTQAHFYVPCPHCETLQTLRFERMKWPDDSPRDAHYICEHGCVIEHGAKTAMLESGKWIHDFPDREIVGFHINALYTPIGLGDSWGKIATVAERAKRDPAKWKTFVNTYLGETHEDKSERLEWETLQARAEPFRLRTIPRGCLLLTAGVDVQKDRIEAMIIGWGRHEVSWTIDYVVIMGDPTKDDVWNELDAYLAKPIPNDFGVPMAIACTLIDAGYIQHDVLNFTRTRGARNIYASKGMPNVGRNVIGRATLVDVKYTGKSAKHGAELYGVGVSTVKHTLHARMLSDGGDGDTPALPADRHVHFAGGTVGADGALTGGLPEEWFRQMASEVFDPKSRKWVKVYERNEALDMYVYATAAAMHRRVRINAMRPEDWDALAAQLETTVAVAPVPQEFGKVAMPSRSGGFFPTSAKLDEGD
jgi:phage terminase large subunit GpA-like protein